MTLADFMKCAYTLKMEPKQHQYQYQGLKKSSDVDVPAEQCATEAEYSSLEM